LFLPHQQKKVLVEVEETPLEQSLQLAQGNLGFEPLLVAMVAEVEEAVSVDPKEAKK